MPSRRHVIGEAWNYNGIVPKDLPIFGNSEIYRLGGVSDKGYGVTINDFVVLLPGFTSVTSVSP